MASPIRLVELSCPRCNGAHWELDNDYRGADLIGERELSYEERTYACPSCEVTGVDFEVEQRAPAEFLLQPHDLYPMTTREFGRWLAIFQAQFPDSRWLHRLGIDWYPGKRGLYHEWRLERARAIKPAGAYSFRLSNDGPEDEAIRVCVQGGGEAHFSIGSGIELERCLYGFDEDDLETICLLLRRKEGEIRATWTRFSSYTRRSQCRWRSKLSRVTV